MREADDASLVAACLGGEREAFDVIVERHRRQVYQVCYRFLGNHEDASDMAQDVFVRIACYRLVARLFYIQALFFWALFAVLIIAKLFGFG